MKKKRLITAKEAHALKENGKEIFWIECYLCKEFGASLEKSLFCSSECEEKIVRARDLIRFNMWATAGNEVEHEGARWKILNTNVHDCSFAANPGLSSYYYILYKGNEEFLKLNDLTTPLKSLSEQARET